MILLKVIKALAIITLITFLILFICTRIDSYLHELYCGSLDSCAAPAWIRYIIFFFSILVYSFSLVISFAYLWGGDKIKVAKFIYKWGSIAATIPSFLILFILANGIGGEDGISIIVKLEFILIILLALSPYLGGALGLTLVKWRTR